MGSMRTLTVITGLVLGTTAPAAHAAPPPPLIFGATTTVFGQAGPPAAPGPGGFIFGAPVGVAAAAGGDTLAVRARAYARPSGDYLDYRSMIDVASRPAGHTRFGPPQDLATVDGYQNLALAGGPGGSAALAFTPRAEFNRFGTPPAVSVRPAGGPFGTLRDLPLAPADGGPRIYDPAVAVAADGAEAVIACARDDRTGVAQVLLWPRSPKATAFSAPRPLGACEHDVSLAADDRGGIVALWAGPSDKEVWVSERARGGVFAAPRAISGDLQVPEGSGVPSPVLAVGPRGDALAAWADGSVQKWIVHAAVRPAGGRWSTPQVLTPPDSPGGAPRAAVNARGDMAVVWDTDKVTEGTFRRRGGRFGKVTGSPHAEGFVFADGVGLTAKGTTVVARSQAGLPAPVLVTRTPGGRWSTQRRVAAEGASAQDAAVAVDRAGNGTLLWSTAGPDGSTVRSTVFTDARPRLSKVRLTTKALHLETSEPVRLTVTARAGRRLARQRRTQVGAGRTTIVRLTAPLRSVLRHSGASVTVRVQDAGGGVVSRRVRPPRRHR